MSFFASDAPEEDDILYGWEFNSYDGRYQRIYAERHCAPFPRPAPSSQKSDHVRPLYVKYLDYHIDEYLLECMFSPFGTVTGSKIFRNRWGVSKGFGFVWFANDREANNAGYWMDGRPIEGFELYVAPAEHWEDRQARLAAKSGQYDDDYYDEDESYEDDDYYDDDDSYEEEASYDDRKRRKNNHPATAPPASTAYYDNGRHHGNYQPNAPVPSASVAYNCGPNGFGHGYSQPPPPQQEMVPNQGLASMPVYQHHIADINLNVRGNQAFYDGRNYYVNNQQAQAPPAPPAHCGIYQPDQPAPSASIAYYVHGNSQPVQLTEMIPKQEPVSLPVNQHQTAAGNPDDDYEEEDESDEDDDYSDDEEFDEEEENCSESGNEAPPLAPTAYYDDGTSNENYQPGPPASVAYYNEGTSGYGYNGHGNSQPVQLPEPVPIQEPALKPVYQQQTTATNPVVIVTEPRGPPPQTVIACCCGMCNTPAQKLELAPARSAAA